MCRNQILHFRESCPQTNQMALGTRMVYRLHCTAILNEKALGGKVDEITKT